MLLYYERFTQRKAKKILELRSSYALRCTQPTIVHLIVNFTPDNHHHDLRHLRGSPQITPDDGTLLSQRIGLLSNIPRDKHSF